MEILIGAQASCGTVWSNIACNCYGNYFSCPYKGCSSHSCGSYSFCSEKGGGSPCIVKC